MITINKEWLQQKIADMEADRDEIPFGLNEEDSNTLAALRIALASLEAEPAIHRWRRVTFEPYGPYPWHYGNFIGFSKPVDGIEDEYYYAAPPATVVPEPATVETTYPDVQTNWQDAKMYAEGWNACRATMLQADNHTEQHLDMVDHSGDDNEKSDCKLPFDQWLSQQNEPIDVDCGCVTSEAFYHWLRVAYEAGNSPVTLDVWVACSERMPEGMTDVHISNGHDVGQGWWDGDTWQTQHDYYSVPGDVTHWTPLPAAPQQEVKSALEHGMRRYAGAMQKLSEWDK
ncbi:DUF551 domain-containing protein [Citrobacter freundii]|uniref:DUF551 domain-containing protein n=1 Tax=Citrobacter freundii TaxID=546 RepID=UPI0015E8EF2E|nr:DUF551 domain-containing protein [Citrobacter freundii]QLX04277.1 DUF551 domain-containing protein [Citrobacter freundii]